MKALALADLFQCVVDCASLWFALMLVEVRLELLSRFVGVEEELLPCPEGQSADIAKRGARRRTDETHDLKVPVRHSNIIQAEILPSNHLPMRVGVDQRHKLKTEAGIKSTARYLSYVTSSDHRMKQIPIGLEYSKIQDPQRRRNSKVKL